MKSATTTLRSATGTLTITPDGPVTPIGERCNALGYKNVRQAAARGDYAIFARRAKTQAEAGAAILNVNVVCDGVNEVEALPRAIQAMLSACECPLSIDFSSLAALEAGLKVCPGRPLINSVNGEEAKLSTVLPLMKQYGAAAVALLVDDSAGLAMDPEKRLAIAARILDRAAGFGLTVDDFIFDCVVLGSATEPQSARIMFETMRRLRDTFGANITLGASNAAFGLPQRELFNAHFLSAAISHGCNVPITDPTLPELKQALLIGDVLRGADEYAINFIRHSRQITPSEKVCVA